MNTQIPNLFASRYDRSWAVFLLRLVIGMYLGLLLAGLRAEVPAGSRAGAEQYFSALSRTLNYSTPEKIGGTTLTDLAAYLGYPNLNAENLEFDDSEALMKLGPQEDDVLVARFFAPKIMNVKFKEGDPEFRLGWRKLIRLRSLPASTARNNNIVAAVILFNTFTKPGIPPYARTNESVNTQVMLLPDPSKIRRLPPHRDPNATLDTVYWLDYENRSAGGTLGYALTASFDANELPGDGAKKYFVPDGCVACHGINPQRPLLNFMDTDHWFDRLENDFPNLKASGQALLVDAGTNDPSAPDFRKAFDRIAKFNREADEHAHQAQPKHDETLASAKWLESHRDNYSHVPVLQRSTGSPHWLSTEGEVLETMNQYCYRCHGTVKFSIFNRTNTVSRQILIIQRLNTNAEVGVKMPPDRPLPDDKREQLVNFFKTAHP